MKTASHLCNGEGEAKYVGQMFQASHPIRTYTKILLYV